MKIALLATAACLLIVFPAIALAQAPPPAPADWSAGEVASGAPPVPHQPPPLPPPGPPLVGLTAAEEDEALSFITEGVPEKVESLRNLKRERPPEYFEVLRHALMEKTHMARLKAEDPEAYQKALKARDLDSQASKLSKQFRAAAGESEKAELRKQIEKVVSDLFELREERRAAEIRQIEKELERLRTTAEKRKKNKTAIIQRRVDELCGLQEAYEW